MKVIYSHFLLISVLIGLASCMSSSPGSSSAPEKDYSQYTNMADVFRSIGGIQVNGYGENVEILLRGNNTFLGNTMPLFVLNNVPLSRRYRDINQINPADIEDVRIVKGLHAINRWGNEANHGAIMIQTKTSKESYSRK